MPARPTSTTPVRPARAPAMLAGLLLAGGLLLGGGIVLAAAPARAGSPAAQAPSAAAPGDASGQESGRPGDVQGAHGTVGRPVNPDTGPGKINRVTVPDFADLIAQVRPAVVTITATLKPGAADGDDDGGDQDGGNGGGNGGGGGGGGGGHGPTRVGGSGFIVDPDGTIVTNNHVVQDTTSITVRLDDGTTLPAHIVGRDPRTDLAVVRVSAGHPLPFLQLGDSAKTRVGQWVVAMGAPYGLGGTATAGIISAEGRDIGSGAYDEYIQIDAPINHGNSGGPTFTQDGKVIGVNTAIYSPTRDGGSIGIGFAIPANLVKIVVSQLQKTGHVVRGFIGVEAQPVSPDMARALGLAQHEGALIAQVEPNSPASRAGLQPGDVIRALDGTPVANPRELAISVLGIAPGETAHLEVMRSGEKKMIDVQVAEAPGDHDAAHGNGTAGGPRVGVTLNALTSDWRNRLSLPADTKGVVISKVDPGSPADTAGIKAGDVIVGVGAKPVAAPAEAIAAIRAAMREHAVALRILRDGRARFVAIPLDTDKG